MLLKSHGRQMCIYNSIRIEKVQIEQFFRQKIRYTTTVEAGVGVGGLYIFLYIYIFFGYVRDRGRGKTCTYCPNSVNSCLHPSSAIHWIGWNEPVHPLALFAR